MAIKGKATKASEEIYEEEWFSNVIHDSRVENMIKVALKLAYWRGRNEAIKENR